MSHRPSTTAPPASRGRPRLRRAAGVAAAGLAAAGLTLGLVQPPATGAGATRLTGDDLASFRGLGDTPLAAPNVDARGTALPTAAQKAAVGSLGADLSWNSFGTPASILPRDGSLGVASTDPAKAPQSARSWLLAHNDVFGLTDAEINDLELVNNQEFAQSDARAVLFRQKFGSLAPAIGGMVTVGVAHGEIAYVSSSLVKNTGSAPAAVLSPQAGWVKAAAAIGAKWLGLDSVVGLGDLSTPRQENGWTSFSVAGFAQPQQARVRALAMADGTVRPVIEANVVNVAGATVAAYTSLVDAVSGETLWRQSQVEQAMAGQAMPNPATGAGVVTAVGMPMLEDNPSKTQFQGEITATDCGPKHEFEITDNDTRQILASATTINIADDIVLKLYGADGNLLTSGDTGTSPEVATASADPFPQGTYSVQVCPFQDPTAPFTPPGNYVGNVALSSSASGDVGLSYPPRWRYFDTNPTFSSANSTDPKDDPKNSVVGCWVTSLDEKPIKGCTEPVGPLRNAGGRAPWDVNPNTELPSFTTFGNNVSDREAWLSPLTPGGFFQAAFSPTREYTTKFTDAWNNSKCDPTNLHPGGNDIDYATQNLFVSHNRMHDYSYFLGFTEKNYNLQVNNFGNGGANLDPEVGNVQAGALSGGSTGQYLGRDNANQIALQDGVPGITNQYLFQPIAGAFYSPCTDGGLDFGIVAHEYTHAISNRMIGGPDEGITSEQGGSMGESWGDLVAGEFEFSHNYKNGGNIWAVGLYATGNKKTAIRDYAINHNPLNYAEFGFDTPGPEVHADGEIWNATMWRVRQALVNKHNKRFPYHDKALQLRCSQGVPNLGPKQSYDCPGNRRWIQLVFDSFLLQQGATDMLQARDAFLAADEMRYDGGNRKAIWRAFAKSGMGKGASTPNADSSDVKPSFAAPSGNRTVSFRPVLPNGKTVPGKVYIGTYEARATPVGDTLGDTKLDAKVPMTPGRYDGIFQSAKTGLSRFTVKVKPGGGKMTKKIVVRPNLAGSGNGAEVVASSADSRNPGFLIDGTEATNWGGVNSGGENVDENSPYVTVDLAGGTHTIRRVLVSAMLGPAATAENVDDDPDTGSRFTALRKFAFEVCTDSCDSDGSWKRVFTSPGNAFPGTLPRPVAPQLNFRTFELPSPVKAQQVRLVALENQCTGYKGYAGEQDNDPTNPTDCKTGSDRGSIVHAAELEVFSR